MKKLKHNSQYADMDEDYEVQLEMIAKSECYKAKSECYKAKLINRLSELEELRQATHDIIKELLKDKEFLEDVLSTPLADCLGEMFCWVCIACVGLVGFFLLFGSLDGALDELTGGVIAGLAVGIVCITFSVRLIRSCQVESNNRDIDSDILRRKLVKIKHDIGHKVVIIKALSNSIETIKRKIEDKL